MRKVVFFIPAIIIGLIYGLAIIARIPVAFFAFAWIALFVLSGVLMSKDKFWGGLFGLLPGVHSMYMSTIDTGQIINIELPFGIVVIAFYLVCCCVVFAKNKPVP